MGWGDNHPRKSTSLGWAEQGYGDNIQFVRYVQILVEAGVNVTLSTHAFDASFQGMFAPSYPRDS